MARDGEVIQMQHFCHHGDIIFHPMSSYVGEGEYIGTPKEHGEHVSQFKTHSMIEAFILKENKYFCPP